MSLKKFNNDYYKKLNFLGLYDYEMYNSAKLKEIIQNIGERLVHIEDYLEEESKFCESYYCGYHEWRRCYTLKEKEEKDKEEKKCSHKLGESLEIKKMYICFQDGCNFKILIPDN